LHYQIGEFAELSGVSTKTLRYYDEIGILRPAAVDSRTRYRRYSTQQLKDLASILALRDLGLSLNEIRKVLAGTDTKAGQLALLLRLRQNAQQIIAKATQSLKCIEAALDLDAGWRGAVSVVMKHRPAIRTASVRARVKTYDGILKFENELLAALPPESIGGLRGVLWHRCADSGVLEGEPFVEIKHFLPRRSFYDLKDLPAATLACAYADTDNDSAELAYDAVRGWMGIRGFALAGPKREIYLDQMLEIQFPLKSA